MTIARRSSFSLYLGLFLLVFFLGTFFRLYRIADYANFLGDEGRDALVVKHLLEGKLTLLGPSTSVGNLYLGPFYYYLMAPALWLSRLDPVGPAILVAILGSLTIGLVFLVGDLFFGRPAGLAAAALYAVSPTIVTHTRFSWNPNPMPFFVLLTVLSLQRLLVAKKGFWLPILGFSLGICLQLHYLALVFIATVFLFLLFSRPRVNRWWFLGGLAAFLAINSPLAIFELRHQFVITQGFFQFLSAGKEVSFSLASFLKTIPSAYWRLFYAFLANQKVWLGAVLAALGLLSLFLLFCRRQKTDLFFLFWIVIGLTGVSFYTGDLHDHYLGFLFPFPFLLLGGLFHHGWQSFRLPAVLSLFLVFAFNFANLDQVAGRGPNYQIERSRQIGESIAQRALGTNFNLSLISPTFDFRAMNYRYFTELYGAVPAGFDQYTYLDALYVIVEDEKLTPVGKTSWEISSFGESEIDEEWRFDFGYKVLKLKKKNG